jgi:tetratricopeptide (TPR) repeat protein
MYKLFKLFSFFIFAIIFFISCNLNNNGSNEIEIVNQNKDSIEIISDKIRETPKNPDLFEQRARLQFDKTNIEEAINDIKIALVLDSLNINYYLTLAEYNLVLGRSGIARKSLEKALEINPKNIEARLKLSQIYFYVQMYKEAMKEIMFLENNMLQNAESYFLKGLILEETESNQEAIRAYKKAIEYDKNFWQAHNHLGLIHYKFNKPIAVEYFKTAVRLFPDNLEIRLNAGITFQEFDQANLAIEQYDYILSVDSTVYIAHYNKGYVYNELLNDYYAAIESFSKAIELDMESHQAYYNRGFAFENLGNLDAAENDYRKALEVFPNYEIAIEGLNEVIDKKTRKY